MTDLEAMKEMLTRNKIAYAEGVDVRQVSMGRVVHLDGQVVKITSAEVEFTTLSVDDGAVLVFTQHGNLYSAYGKENY